MHNDCTPAAPHGRGGAGTPAGIAQLTFAALDDSTQLRVWNGYPDRWCDGSGTPVVAANTRGC